MPIGALVGATVVGAGTSLISGSKQAGAIEDASAQTDATNRYIYDTTRADYAPARQVGQGALYKLADMYGVSRPSGQQSLPTQQPDALSQYYGDGAYWPALHNVVGWNGVPQTGVAGQATAAPGTTGMTAGFDGFQTSPGYQFRVDEASKAIERSAAARGGLRSGATMDALQRRVQGVASDEYENFANRLANLAGIGQSSTAGSAQSGQAYANQSAQTNMAAGNARASAYQNQANLWNQGLQGAASGFAYNRNYYGSGFGGGGGGYDRGYGSGSSSGLGDIY